MPLDLSDQAAIVGIGTSPFGRVRPESKLELAATALESALDDAGLSRTHIDGVAINLGWPLGLDYDRVAEAFGLDIRYVLQTWTHGRFVTMCLQNAAMAVATGLADVVACVTACCFSQNRGMLGGPHDIEGYREDGGAHGETPHYGLTGPASGAALAMQRYMHLYGVTTDALANVCISTREHALGNPGAIMDKPLTIEDHRNAREIVEPLKLFDCCLVNDGAVVVLVTSAERARDLAERPVYLSGMQGLRSGRDEFIFAPPGLGIGQQQPGRFTRRRIDHSVYEMAGISLSDIDALYTYDAFSPLVLFVLERFGFCAPGEAADFVASGAIGPGGSLPVNTSGGLLSEAHLSGWNSIVELTRQLRGDAENRQVPGAKHAQWATVWGDSIVFRR